MLIIGIDPGNKGGVGVLNPEGNFITAFPMPDKYNLEDKITEVLINQNEDDVFFCIEKSFPSHNQGITSIFNHGMNYGVYIKTLDIFCSGLYGGKFLEVLPQTWKSSFSLSKDKQKSMDLCLYLFPESKSFIHGKKGGMLDGVAEGILLAEYGRQYLKRQLVTGGSK
jgi:hypothetical protein